MDDAAGRLSRFFLAQVGINMGFRLHHCGGPYRPLGVVLVGLQP
jgi:hypothetical protein